MKTVVLAGGLSPERDVSLVSGCLIANALMKAGHSVLLLDVYKDYGEDIINGFRTSGEYSHVITEEVPDLDALKAEKGDDSLIGKNVLDACSVADAVFLALHGAMGENGQIQAALDTRGIKYTGSGYLGSAIAMDKDITKQILCHNGIPTPEWVTVDPEKADTDRLIGTVGLPCVVKPCSCGSSVGISMVEDRDALVSALAEAKKYENRVLVEKKITGREITVAVLDGKVLPMIEIIPKSGFYDYKNKYQSGRTVELCPAPIDADIASELERITLEAFACLRLRSYARFDYILDRSGKAWCLEANTLPGMTPMSLLPQMAASVGIDYVSLCSKIISMADKD